MHNFDSAFKIVCSLVNDFKENERKYIAPAYQEAEVRRDFIDKFFEALGWDVYHKTQKNPYEQEVKVEKGVSVGAAQKRADYAFYIKPEFRQPKFFAEAKKPNRSLKNAQDYFQAVRYGWSAKTPVAVLTDFEEFHILDCRIKPNIKNILQNLHHKEYRYTDFPDEEKFKELYFLFSRDAVANDSLKKYSDALPKIKGKAILKAEYQAIDDDFLEYIDGIRETLAKAFKKNDTALKSEELTEATQRTIDRLVFIRFLEDKLIEPEYIVSEFGKKQNPWKEFITTCRALDAKYNGIVFKKHFIDEQNFSGPEQNTFKKICDDISYLNSPYDFNAIPVHILGSIYERFLGKVVNATARQVKVEEKPEVRKAGGVYYTPKYIVDYIVENTVGKILKPCHSSESWNPAITQDSGNSEAIAKHKTPLEISKLRFADIACGSGSFLIGVFETLLKYHIEYYQSHPDEAKKGGCLNKDGQWVLSIKQKQNILLNNIYGVDIDQQAVEVTQLSLALKMLEDETTATANDMQVLFHEKILPDLSKNIVCGNSLIGTDIIYEENALGFSEANRKISIEEERKLNPMDFETVFPHIFNGKLNLSNDNSSDLSSRRILGRDPHNNGGFDAIVGNPPYLRIQGLQENYNTNIDYYIKNYKSAVKRFDIYLLFLEKGFTLLKNKGTLGYICPHKFLNSDFGSGIRELLINNSAINKIINFGQNLIFEQASTYTGLFFLSKNKNESFKYYEFVGDLKKDLPNQLFDLSEISFSDYNINNFTAASWILTSSISKNILDKFSSFPKIKDIFSQIFQGVVTGFDDVYYLQKKDNSEGQIINVYSTIEQKDISIERELLKPMLKGDDIKRYQKPDFIFYNIYPYKLVNGKTKIYEEDELKNKFPLGYDYLRKFNKELRDLRIKFKTNVKYWYSCHRGRDMNIFEQERIITPYASLGCNMTISPAGLYHNTKVYSIIPNEDRKENKYYWLALLNSKIMWYFMKNTGYVLRGGYYTFTTDYLSPFPIKIIDFSKESEKRSHDLIVSLVDQMLSAKKQLHESKTDKDKTYYERRCTDLDRQIDAEVYKLYDLTEEEIKIVEGKE